MPPRQGDSVKTLILDETRRFSVTTPAAPAPRPGGQGHFPESLLFVHNEVILNADMDTHTSYDAFSFDISFRHGSEDPAAISAALELAPSFSWSAGQVSPVGVHKHMCWEGTLTQGSGQGNFDSALRAVAATLENHQPYFRELIASGCEITITCNFHVDSSLLSAADLDADSRTESKVFEMALYPEFIASVSAIPVALRLQVWG
jgi:Domain of unknown function (DUF4279)